MAYTYEQLRQLSIEGLIQEHDARIGGVVLGINYFLEEISRRDNVRIARQMLWMTLAITVCTVVMTALTAVLVMGTSCT